MSIYCSTFHFFAYPYEGSHIIPSRRDAQFGIDVAYPAPHVPTRLEQARGRDYIEARENGRRHHPWLRFSPGDDDHAAFVMHERDVRELRDFFDRWLARPKVTRTG